MVRLEPGHRRSHPNDLKTGKAPKVAEGQLIGLAGNAGSSAGPHLHIQADRVRPEFLGDITKLIAAIKARADVSFFRPLQFHRAKTMINNSGVKPGGVNANPGLSDMEGHGAYFNPYVVLPPDFSG